MANQHTKRQRFEEIDAHTRSEGKTVPAIAPPYVRLSSGVKLKPGDEFYAWGVGWLSVDLSMIYNNCQYARRLAPRVPVAELEDAEVSRL